MGESNLEHKTYILNFFYDSKDACALTALINDVRFHIIVEPDDLKSSEDDSILQDYMKKLTRLRDADNAEREPESRAKSHEERSNGQAEDSSHSSTSKHDAQVKSSSDKDSAVDLTADQENAGSDWEESELDATSAGVELHNWMLGAFAEETAKWAPPGREQEESSLYEWYHGPTYYYSLRNQEGALVPYLLEDNEELAERIANLVPRISMPKYIQSMDLPWLHAKDLTVRSEVEFPEPAHPGRVEHKDGQTLFFKPVDSTHPQPTKREIKILRQIEKLNLAIKVPTLQGLVAYENSKTEIMGLLLSNIDEPRPLTKLLDADVSEEKRARWSEKSEEYVKALHEHGIIWGDAKADNFMVDKHDELWIIDFGGSYTEGWIDPELSETFEGDRMGLERIVNALEDPEGNTVDPEGSQKTGEGGSLFVTEWKDVGKRKRSLSQEEISRSIDKKARREDDGVQS